FTSTRADGSWSPRTSWACRSVTVVWCRPACRCSASAMMEGSTMSANTMSRPATSRCSGWAWSGYNRPLQCRRRHLDVATETDIEDGVVETARRVLPGGTFGNYAAEVVIREGKGGRVWDENGKEYVDYLLGSGPMLVGHAHPEVNAAVAEQIQ